MHEIIKILHQTQKTLHQTFFFLPQIRKFLLQISIFYTKLVTLLGFRTNVLKKFIISNSKQRIDRKQQKHIKLIFQKNEKLHKPASNKIMTIFKIRFGKHNNFICKTRLPNFFNKAGLVTMLDILTLGWSKLPNYCIFKVQQVQCSSTERKNADNFNNLG